MKKAGLFLFVLVGFLFLSACSDSTNGQAENEELDKLNDRITQLEEDKQAKDEELAAKDKQITELESTIVNLENQLENPQAGEEEVPVDEEAAEEVPSDSEDTDEVASDEEQLRETADAVVDALGNKDFASFASFVHPAKGVRFSPYIYVDVEEHLQFSAEKIGNFTNDSETYTWGSVDGSGNPIELTPSEYYDEFIFIRDFTQADEVTINDIQTRGSMIVNVEEVYPEASFVSYYVDGTKQELDWADLILVFEKEKDTWYLVGLVVDRYTI
ncbi:hypothetical protein [Oceanobacillus chungangensis]|uniref:Uncharacterized protein n=1 Tax=Oceanobacillus chungangensis TaxID=1229152 RepID=A0A3D8PVK9_9BACI|nr:hypothetical protein [Oceanobacillus chungangensis]RDW19772.1 hypothetical protein CWR45_06795 [Oceanobacillus chungangensis]